MKHKFDMNRRTWRAWQRRNFPQMQWLHDDSKRRREIAVEIESENDRRAEWLGELECIVDMAFENHVD